MEPDRLNASSKSLSTRSTCSVEWTRYREAGKLPDRLHLLNQQAQGHQERCVQCACDEVAPGSWVQCTVTCGKDIRLRTIRSRGDEQCLNSVSVWSSLVLWCERAWLWSAASTLFVSQAGDDCPRWPVR